MAESKKEDYSIIVFLLKQENYIQEVYQNWHQSTSKYHEMNSFIYFSETDHMVSS